MGDYSTTLGFKQIQTQSIVEVVVTVYVGIVG